VIRDVRDAFRREPWSMAAMVSTLAFGIGASVAVFAICNHILFRPVPGVSSSDRLVRVVVQAQLPADWPGVKPGDPPHIVGLDASPAHIAAAREMPAFSGLAGAVSRSYAIAAGDRGSAEVVRAGLVTRDYFDVLGVRVVAGRVFAPEEYDRPGVALVVVSERLWRQALAGRSDAIGQTIIIAGQPFTVIGVVRDFRGLSRVGSEDFWLPALDAARLDGAPLSGFSNVVARLAGDVSLEAATAQATAAFARAGAIEMRGLVATPIVVPGAVPVSSADATLLSTLSIGGAGAVLLLALACANAGSLVLSRNLARQRELAVRAALGATRAQLFRSLLAELCAVSGLAAMLGLLIANGLVAIVSTLELRGYIALADVSLDWRVAAFAVAVATITVLVAGLAPSILASRADPQIPLRGAGRGVVHSARARQALVVVQLAATFVLLAGAGVLVRSLVELHSVDLGFAPDRLVTVSDRIDPTRVGRTASGARQFHAELQRRLSETAGIEAAAYSGGTQLQGQFGARVAPAAESPLSDPVVVREVSTAYFRTMGIGLVAGRDFAAEEAIRPTLSGHVIVDELLARQVFGDAPAVGRRLWLSPYWLLPGARPSEEVIGVVRATVSRDLRLGPRPTLYVPVGGAVSANYEVRTRLPVDEAAAVIRRVVAEIDPLIPIGAITSTTMEIDQAENEDVILGRLASVFAVMALGLALAGAYAVTACVIVERTREFGIRLALGASPQRVARAVLARSAVHGALGIVIGTAMYLEVSRFLESRVFGIPAADTTTMAIAAGGLLIATMAAAWRPAQRAASVDPALSLRSTT
jgi:predicted permease